MFLITNLHIFQNLNTWPKKYSNYFRFSTKTYTKTLILKEKLKHASSWAKICIFSSTVLYYCIYIFYIYTKMHFPFIFWVYKSNKRSCLECNYLLSISLNFLPVCLMTTKYYILSSLYTHNQNTLLLFIILYM